MTYVEYYRIVEVLEKQEHNRVKAREKSRSINNVVNYQKIKENPTSLTIKNTIQEEGKDIRVIVEILYLEYNKISKILEKEELNRIRSRERYHKKITERDVKTYDVKPKMVRITIKKVIV